MAGLVFTQKSVAFPSLPIADRVVDDVYFRVEYSDGLQTGEMSVEWIQLSGRNVPRIVCFTESLDCLTSDPVQRLIGYLKEDPEMQPREFVEVLERVGGVPSTYHLHGLQSRPGMTTLERAKIQERLDSMDTTREEI